MSRIDELADLIRPFIGSNESGLLSVKDFERALTEDPATAQRMPTSIGLKPFVVERSESVTRQLDGEQTRNGDGDGLGCFKRDWRQDDIPPVG